ncbi:histone deacetylase HDT1-like isoform X2 [Mercurialis annua]|uniref:histone deacetylase HDT1-like isoform X2 n=1 Tax=Mercurialis annua TaxID=3986 RepID=UPI00215E5BA4|nr:histone deacetylase HDT1-like isoform X2 [Mercurialis annua]
MEFWGVEIKAGETLKVGPEPEFIIHLSQAALGESKKGIESVPLYVKINDKKILLGTLSHEKFPQLSLDIVFEKEVELSHSWKNGSVYLSGYQTLTPDAGDEDMYSDEEDSEDEEPLPVPVVNAGKAPQVTPKVGLAAAKAKGKPDVAKPDSSIKPKAKAAQPIKAEESDDDDDDESDEDEDGEGDESSGDDVSVEGMSVDDDSEDEDDSESEDEETPKKADKGKKRQNDSALKTPVSSKKAKSGTPQKTDDKKNVHTATPHPAKGGKPSANGTASKTQTPKSAGKFSCNSCDRSFTSDVGLQSHSKAKHAGK